MSISGTWMDSHLRYQIVPNLITLSLSKDEDMEGGSMSKRCTSADLLFLNSL